MMKNLQLAFVLLMAPMAAQAEEAIIVADCTNTGCTCHVSAISRAEIAELTGMPIPSDAAQQTLVMHAGEFIWSKTPRDDLDLMMGGNGVCEIEVFAPITPLDGVWTGNVRVTDIEGCAPAVVEMVPPMVAGMSQTQRIVWGGRFDPAKLATGGKSPVVKWSKASSNYFTGTVPQTPNGVIEISVNATATLTAPDRAEATLRIRFDPVSGSDAGTMGLIGMNGCEANAAYEFLRTGE